ncbi:hypothetical protein DMI70_19355 [Escherichia coli]|nr:hypothetical protein [Escherichia coli]
MNTKPSIFSFESSCQIRMFMIDGEPWFVTKDVCNALNIDVTQARKLDKKGWNKKGLYSIQTQWNTRTIHRFRIRSLHPYSALQRGND